MRKLLVLTIVIVAALIVAAPRFRQWSTDRAEGRVGSAGLRLAVLQRKFVGATSAADSDEVKCVVMDWNLGGETVATLVAFADGTTSLYLTSGGGILGAGSHENVREAAARFRALAADRADQFSTTADFDPPASGKTRFFIITGTKTLATQAQRNGQLLNQYIVLKPLAEAAQATISEIRQRQR